MRHSTLPVILATVALTSCSTPPIEPFARFYEGGQPSIAGIAPYQSRLLFSIVREGVPARQTQAVAGLAYASASITLSNDSAAVLPAPLAKSVNFDGSHAASSVFTALRPGGGYNVRVALLDNTNQQVGSGVGENIALPAGQTTAVTIVIGRDGDVRVSSSQVGNSFGTTGSYVLTKGDTVVLNTGFSGTEAAVQSWAVFLSPELTNTAVKTRIASFPATTPFSTFTWPTGTENTNAGWSYLSNLLTTTGAQNGTITFELYDAADKVVGRSTLTGVSAVAGANMDLQLQ
ncbi:MAG: hypothetical protein ACM3YO_04035 [Bacteroidota bacterium]